MSTNKHSRAAASRIAGLGIVAALAVGMATPSFAAETASGVSAVHQAAATDISAARRQHRARHASPRDAYGSYVGGASGVAPQSQNFGYGVGDNSRNQTW